MKITLGMGYGSWLLNRNHKRDKKRNPKQKEEKMIDASMPTLESPHFSILKQRALKSLANPSEICDSILRLALQDAHEACKGKDVPNYIRIDFAYVRLKLYVKIDLNGEDELLLKNALEAIAKANSFDTEGALHSSQFYVSGIREESI